MGNIHRGIKVTNGAHRSGKSAKDIMILNKEFLSNNEESYSYKNNGLIVSSAYLGTRYLILNTEKGSVLGDAVKIVESTTGIGIKIYQITRYVYFMITWTGVGDENIRSKKTLKMFRVNWDDEVPTITFGSGFDICTANSATDINDAFLLAAINSGDFPNEFMVYRMNQKIATGICTYYYVYLYMNISTLKLTYATSNNATSWTTIGADTTYEVNLPYGQDIENSYAYILRKTISNNAVSAYYLLSRNEEVLTKTITTGLAMHKVISKLDSGHLILEYPDQKEAVQTGYLQVGHLNESTGDIVLEYFSFDSTRE